MCMYMYVWVYIVICYGLEKWSVGVSEELADRPHLEGGGKWCLFKLATFHKWGPGGIDIGPNTV